MLGELIAKFVAFIVDHLIKGVGYFLCLPFKRSANPDGPFVYLVGTGFWFVVVALVVWAAN